MLVVFFYYNILTYCCHSLVIALYITNSLVFALYKTNSLVIALYKTNSLGVDNSDIKVLQTNRFKSVQFVIDWMSLLVVLTKQKLNMSLKTIALLAAVVLAVVAFDGASR